MGTPRDIVQKISAESIRMLSAPDVEKMLVSWGVEKAAMGVEGFEKTFLTEIAKFEKLARDARIPQVD